MKMLKRNYYPFPIKRKGYIIFDVYVPNSLEIIHQNLLKVNVSSNNYYEIISSMGKIHELKLNNNYIKQNIYTRIKTDIGIRFLENAFIKTHVNNEFTENYRKYIYKDEDPLIFSFKSKYGFKLSELELFIEIPEFVSYEVFDSF